MAIITFVTHIYQFYLPCTSLNILVETVIFSQEARQILY